MAKLLLALDYDKEYDLIMKNSNEFRRFVVWLENNKIRHYTKENRANLVQINAPEWNQSFVTYLDDVGVKYSKDKKPDIPKVVEALLRKAIALEYHDKAEQYNGVAKIEVAPLNLMLPNVSTDEKMDVEDNPEFRTALELLCSSLDIPVFPEFSNEVLLQTIQDLVTQVTTEQDASSPTSEDISKNFNLGFTTHDEKVDRAAYYLRKMYLARNKESQHKMNELITEMQEITANPRIIKSNK